MLTQCNIEVSDEMALLEHEAECLLCAKISLDLEALKAEKDKLEKTHLPQQRTSNYDYNEASRKEEDYRREQAYRERMRRIETGMQGLEKFMHTKS